MAKINIKFNNKTYSIPFEALADTIASLEAHLVIMKDQPVQTLAPGLYQTGAIALWQEGNYDAASAMMITPWEELEENGVLAVGEGVILPDNLPELNEYGFYYGVPYSTAAQGMTISFTFNEDGSAVFNQAGEITELPAGSAIYGDHAIDMTSILGGIFVVLPEGHTISMDDILFSIGSGFPIVGGLYVLNFNTINGDLVLSNTVTCISERAFQNENPYDLTGLFVPSNVTSIGPYAFADCNRLVSLEFGANSKLMSIGDHAFHNCSSLTTITIPNGVTYIRPYTFYNCSNLTTTTIPSSVMSIGDYAFYVCTALTSIAIPNGVTSIHERAFRGCSGMTSITIPASVIAIGDYVFEDCGGFTSITVASGNTKYHSAGNCLIETATGTLMLGGKNSVIPTDGSVTAIGSGAFHNCTGLTTITIPASVTSIGTHAFDGCSKLITVYYGGTITQWNAITKAAWHYKVPATHVHCTDGDVEL